MGVVVLMEGGVSSEYKDVDVFAAGRVDKVKKCI